MLFTVAGKYVEYVILFIFPHSINSRLLFVSKNIRELESSPDNESSNSEAVREGVNAFLSLSSTIF
jgi:hypothetical protein